MAEAPVGLGGDEASLWRSRGAETRRTASSVRELVGGWCSGWMRKACCGWAAPQNEGGGRSDLVGYDGSRWGFGRVAARLGGWDRSLDFRVVHYLYCNEIRVGAITSLRS